MGDEDRLQTAVKEVRDDATGEIIRQPGDLTDTKNINEIIERTVEEFGGIDHLVTSAGGPPSGPFLEKDDDDWYEAFDLLVMSVVRLVRESVNHLRANGGGIIVNITSRSVKEAIDGLVLSNSVRMSVIDWKRHSQKSFPQRYGLMQYCLENTKRLGFKSWWNKELNAANTTPMKKEWQIEAVVSPSTTSATQWGLAGLSHSFLPHIQIILMARQLSLMVAQYYHIYDFSHQLTPSV